MSTTNPTIGDTARVMVFWTTRKDVERVFARLWQRRHKIAAKMSRYDFEWALHGAIGMLRSAREWSHESDLARVDTDLCRDLATLHHAAREVFAGDDDFLDELGHITDAASSGYWSACEEDTEAYVYREGGGDMVRERGKEVDE